MDFFFDKFDLRLFFEEFYLTILLFDDNFDLLFFDFLSFGIDLKEFGYFFYWECLFYVDLLKLYKLSL